MPVTPIEFSKINPNMQLRVNSSSLGPMKQCPRKYEYSVIRGLGRAGNTVDTDFGTLVHEGVEFYDNLKVGMPDWGHDKLLEQTLIFVLRKTWDFEHSRPIDSNDSKKNRESLCRALVWYLDKHQDDNMETVKLPNGVLALELKFEFDIGYITKDGERATLVGTLDKIVKFNGKYYIKDVKTTGGSLGSFYFTRYSPNNQVSLYALAGKICFDLEISGLIIDAIQVGASFVRTQREIIPRPKGVLEEWLQDVNHWIAQMESCAISNYWPQNDESCGAYGGCKFREICSMSPMSRETWLDRDFGRVR